MKKVSRAIDSLENFDFAGLGRGECIIIESECRCSCVIRMSFNKFMKGHDCLKIILSLKSLLLLFSLVSNIVT